MPAEFEEENDRLPLCQVNEIYKGHEVSTHGLIHPFYERLTYDEICADITADITNLEKLTGVPCKGHAYPCGGYNDTVVKAFADCGIRYARTTKNTHSFAIPENPLILHPTCHHSDDEMMSLIEKFIAAEPTDGDLLFYVWGHTYEFDLNIERNNWDYIEEVCKKISGKSDIEYVTNMQFFDR